MPSSFLGSSDASESIPSSLAATEARARPACTAVLALLGGALLDLGREVAGRAAGVPPSLSLSLRRSARGAISFTGCRYLYHEGRSRHSSAGARHRRRRLIAPRRAWGSAKAASAPRGTTR